MTRPLARGAALALPLLWLAGAGSCTSRPTTVRSSAASAAELTGTVRSRSGAPIPGAFVSARDSAAGITISVVTDVSGRYRIHTGARTIVSLTAHEPRHAPSTRPSTGASLDFALDPAPPAEAAARAPSASVLGLLPDGEQKRRFMLDCTGCHQFDQKTIRPEGVPRTHEQWIQRVTQMVQLFGHQSGFPIIAPNRHPDSTTAYLERALTDRAWPSSVRIPETRSPSSANAVITEYDLPEPRDLPHDLMLDASGNVVITGMFSARFYVLDPATGRFGTEAIPLQGANPRALHVERDGTWWALLGAPKRIARRDAVSKQWTFHDIGVYGHSLAPDSSGAIWYNGHFTANPARIGRLDPKTGAIETFDIPAAAQVPTGGGPIPYEIKAADDGTIWGSELHGNRVYSFTPSTRAFRTWEMPTSHSGPRRLDIAPDGVVWIPAYAAGALVRLDPRSGRLTEIAMPTRDALPYIARVDRRTGDVWVATGAADLIARFEPRTSRWTEYPLPTKGALVRHIDIGPAGDVWAAYGASPGIPAKIAHLELLR